MKTIRENSNIKRVNSFFALLTILSITTAILFFARSLHNIQEAQFEERVNSTNILAEKVSKQVQIVTDFNWKSLHTVRNFMQQKSYVDEEELKEQLQAIEQLTGDTVWAIDKNSQCYTDDGKGNIWQKKDLLITGKDEFFAADFQFGIGGEMKMYYLSPLEETIKVGDTELSHIVLVSDMSALDSYYDLSNFGNDSLAFIIHENGSQVYHNNDNNNHNNVLRGAYNLLTALEEASYHQGASYEKLQDDIANQRNNTLSITYQNREYYLSYYALNFDDWVTLLLIPESSVGSGAINLSNTITKNVAMIFTIMLLVLIEISAWLFTRNRMNQKIVNERLVSAAEAEKAANKAKTDFLSSMSHDIRTPMNAIVGITRLAGKRVDNPFYMKDALDQIQIAAGQLLTLINDVLDISKIESGSVMLEEDSFSVHELMQKIEILVTPDAKKKHQHLSINIHDITDEYLKGDILRLNQISLNLISNAIKYTDDGGQISIEVFEETVTDQPDKSAFHLIVQDNGIGMSKEFQEHMYTSFAREKDTKINQVQGTGLGLAICKELVDLMGGSIQCESEVNQGTKFMVRIELKVDSLEHEQDDKLAEEEHPSISVEGMHLLVVEDNNLNWKIVRAILLDEGITCERAENGQKCLDLLEHVEPNHFDAVLMDVEMPVMNGKEATRRIRASEKSWLKNLTIIATTANAFAEDIQACLDAGMNTHIAKPLDIDKLVKILAKVKEEKTKGGTHQ